MKSIKNKIENLKKVINNWNHAYYVLDNPLVEDAEYDKALNELINLEKLYPQFLTEDSPTQKVGGSIIDKFEKYKHKTSMLSLSNAFNIDDIKNFDKQILNEVKETNYSFFVDPKIDGLSISLIYKNGKLVKGVTRGDGVYGEDVTNNVKTIKSIPLSILDKGDYIEIRGEVYLSKKEFERINLLRNKNNEEIFANPRNAAAGTLRQLDSSIAASRKLDAYLYYFMDRKRFNTHSESLNYLKKMGFKVNELGKLCSSINEVFDHIEYISKMRKQLNYDIDGAVIKVNDFKLYEKIGYTSKFPKWAIAFKFPAEIKETKLLDIFASVGRTGKITYNAVLESVQIAGTKVQAATLHNAEFIIQRDIRIGGIVKIKKAGDIIPEIIAPIKNEQYNNLQVWKKIKNCPICNCLLEVSSGEVDQYCINLNCPGKIIKSLEHYVSREAMNIKGLSIKLIEKLYNNNFIKSFVDLYKLKNYKDQIIKLDKIGKKLAENLINAIENSKKNSLEKLFYGLGIRHVGKKTANLITSIYKDIDKIKNANLQELENIKDIGPIVAKSIIDWFKIEENCKLLEFLKKEQVNMKFLGCQINKNNAKITMKNFVITGTLSKPRNIYKKLLESYGAKISEIVTKKTDFLLVGKNPGSKILMAKNLNIKILTEKELMEMVGEENENWLRIY